MRRWVGGWDVVMLTVSKGIRNITASRQGMKDIWCETDSKFILISYISYSLQSPAGNPSPEQKAGSQSPEEQEEGAEVWFSESREGGLTLLLPPWQGWWG